MSIMPEAERVEKKEYITFVAGGQSFCIHIKKIREIRSWTPTTILPFAEPHVLGVINLRGAVIPIIDLAAKLGFDKIVPTERHVIIIVAIEDRITGVLVESVSEILSISHDRVKEAPKSADDDASRAVDGIIPRETDMIKIVNLDALLTSQDAALT